MSNTMISTKLFLQVLMIPPFVTCLLQSVEAKANLHQHGHHELPWVTVISNIHLVDCITRSFSNGMRLLFAAT
eukprot:c44564_g1_i1 orf=135-353(-)